MATSDHLFNKRNQKIRQAKNQVTYQITEDKLKQLDLWNCYLVFNGSSILYLTSFLSPGCITVLKFLTVLLK